MAFFQASEVSFRYPEQTDYAVKKLSFTINKGDFVVIMGASGSGKSTLLRLMKTEVAPHGELNGHFYYKGHPLTAYDPEVLTKDIGMVFQDPENQIVMDNVMEELVFGLENLRLSTSTIQKKVAEMVHFFGLEDLLSRKTYALSGGQKQLINLSAVLLMEPKVLLLDEPTAQLDPVASKQFIAFLKQMNEELGLTVLLVEHRLEEVLPFADHVIIMDKGSVVQQGSPRSLAGVMSNTKFQAYLPAAAALSLAFSRKTALSVLPLTIKEGKRWLRRQTIRQKVSQQEKKEYASTPLLQAIRLDFQYERSGARLLNKLSFTLYKGERFSIVGGNGSGKSTLLKVLAQLLKPQRGKLLLAGKSKRLDSNQIGYLPQNPKFFFIEETLIKEMKRAASGKNAEERQAQIDYFLDGFQLASLTERHPYDLSSGEQQKAVLACLLLRKPELLLIDEPTKGLDPDAKRHLLQLFQRINQEGVTIIIVTHDIEFAARFSSRCGMLFQGQLTAVTDPDTLFKGNAFYTTAINRLTRHEQVPEVLTLEEARQTWDIDNA